MRRKKKTGRQGGHRQCNEHELGQTPGDGEGQGGLACWSPWGCKESDTTGQLNSNHKGWSRDQEPEHETPCPLWQSGLHAH